MRAKVILAGLIFILMAAVLVRWRWSVNRERRAKASDLRDSALLIATACQSASPAELQSMRLQLEKDEAAITKDMSWEDGAPWWDLSGKIKAERHQAKAAFHNRLVRWGCFEK